MVAEALKDDPDVGIGAATLHLGGPFLEVLNLPAEQYQAAAVMVNKALEFRSVEQRNLAAMIASYLR